MTTRERMLRILLGGAEAEADITPYSVYKLMVKDMDDLRWRRLFDAGLGLTHYEYTYKTIEHGVREIRGEKRIGEHLYHVHRKETPVGAIQRVRRSDGWREEEWIKSPADYKVMRWIVENSEILPAYEMFARGEELVGDLGVTLLDCHRTPIMEINVDWVGTEQFCFDVALEVPELFELYEVCKKRFIERIKLVCAGPGQIVKLIENLTIGMLGPQRYRDYLMNIYHEIAPLVMASGKKLLVHYDGALSPIADQIAAAPFHIIESLTEPPEGDMTYDQCRAAWPDKVLWSNINVGLYALPADELRAAVTAKRARAGKKGVIFEISEDLPSNWETAIPLVLDALSEAG